MKNKKITYALILSVMAVWGIIFYKIVLTSKGEETFAPPVSYTRSSYESLDDYRMRDTATLALSYRDPFLGESELRIIKEQAPVDASPSKSFLTTLPAAAPPVNWDIIKYTGYIVNRGMNRMVAIMNINGKEYMLSEGQKADGVVLERSYRDSVKVLYMNKTKFIKVQ